MRVMSRHTSRTTNDASLLGQPNRVALTPSEHACKDRFDAYVKAGSSVADAAEQALSSLFPDRRTKPFVDWLSEGTLTLDHRHQLMRTAEPARRTGPIMTANMQELL